MALNSNFRTLTADNMEGVVSTRNYLKNSFENGSLTGWTELSVALTSGLPTGTPTISAAAASSLTLSVTSTTPLSLDKSLLVSVPSALTAGQGFISDAFTLDRMDLGKVITVSFDYERISGTYNFSGTLGSQTWMVYVYDVTAGGANWIQPAGFLGMNQSSSAGRVACTFQSSVVAGQQYRIAVIASQAAAGASSIELDNFTASRQTAPIGPVVTDWVSYTPTGSWTVNTTYSGKWRRVGDAMEVNVGVSLSGAPNAANLTVNIPSGFSTDGTKMTSVALTDASVSGQILKGVTGYAITGYVNNSTSIQLVYISNGSVSSESPVSSTAPVSFANGDAISVTFRVPISGWSSNVQLSNDTDTRVVALRATNSISRTMSFPYTSPTVAIFETVENDTHGAYSTANGLYRVPVSGFYRVTHHFLSNSASLVAGQSLGSWVQKNGSNHSLLAVYRTPVASNTIYEGSGSTIVFCNAGDTLACALYSDVATTSYTGAPTTNYLSIERLSGPSVVAASESVSAIYQTSAGQSIPHNSATVIVFGTKIFDSHSAMNASTGVFTCPVSGEYQLSAAFYFSTAITATATDIQTIAYKNGVAYLGVNNAKSGTAAAPLTTSGTIRIRCNAGDTLSCAVLQANSATTAQTLLTNAAFNWVAISRVGN